MALSDHYVNKRGEQLWYDDVGIGVEEMRKKWAEKHLINIEPI